MPLTVEEVYRQALALSDESKESLAERIVSYLETKADPAVQQAHIEIAKRRRDEVRTGRVVSLDGEEVLAKARAIVGK
jgi:hypothetical protein